LARSGLLTRPGFYGGQQKSGNNCRGIAKNHFVAMPLKGGELAMIKGESAGIDQSPQPHAEDGKNSREEKKRTKSEIEQGKPRFRGLHLRGFWVVDIDGHSCAPVVFSNLSGSFTRCKLSALSISACLKRRPWKGCSTMSTL